MTRKICSVLSMVVFLGLLVIAGFLFVPKMLGYDEYAVLSGSMEPGIPVGAIVYDKNFAASEAREGAVVTYQLPAGTLVTHRIISVDKEEQTVVTQETPIILQIQLPLHGSRSSGCMHFISRILDIFPFMQRHRSVLRWCAVF